MTKNICLFASYLSGFNLLPDTQHYLKQLHLCGWEVHLILSGKTILSAELQNFCSQYTIIPHLRPNQGMDFGAWQDLILKKITDNADYILLTNDSIFGPIYPLQPIFKRISTLNLNLWGMIESYEINWHFQSWFLCFDHKSFNHPKIQNVFLQPFKNMDKPTIIQQGELKLGKVIQEIPNFNYKAAWSPKGFRPFRNKYQVNPMHIDWYSILKSGNVPFIKKELIRNNHFGIFWLNHYREYLKNNKFFPLSNIDKYLEIYVNNSLFKPYTVWWKRLKYLAITFDTKLAWKYFMKQGVSCPFLA